MSEAGETASTSAQPVVALVRTLAQTKISMVAAVPGILSVLGWVLLFNKPTTNAPVQYVVMGSCFILGAVTAVLATWFVSRRLHAVSVPQYAILGVSLFISLPSAIIAVALVHDAARGLH